MYNISTSTGILAPINLFDSWYLVDNTLTMHTRFNITMHSDIIVIYPLAYHLHYNVYFI